MYVKCTYRYGRTEYKESFEWFDQRREREYTCRKDKQYIPSFNSHVNESREPKYKTEKNKTTYPSDTI